MLVRHSPSLSKLKARRKRIKIKYGMQHKVVEQSCFHNVELRNYMKIVSNCNLPTQKLISGRRYNIQILARNTITRISTTTSGIIITWQYLV
jgi:hypothetical protein